MTSSIRAPFQNSGPSDDLRISIVIPVYASERTLAACLAALRHQSLSPFETIVVDSGPNDACERIVEDEVSEVTYTRSLERLIPHAAQNFGFQKARGDLLVFMDPDVYPAPDWLERLVAAHGEHGRAICGAIACHGDAWLSNAMHLCKFSKWLPAGSARPVDMAPSTNFLISRSTLERAGGFPTTPFLGDVALSRWLSASDQSPWFEPRAVVAHHHLGSVGSFLAERVSRGRGYGALRGSWISAWRAALLLGATPLRLVRILGLVHRHARAAHQERVFARSLPVVFAGHAAFLLGESWATLLRLLLLRERS